jgi:hypothetical protein
MTIITLVAGAIVFIYSYHVVSSYSNEFSSRALGAGRSLSVAVLASFIRGSNQVIVIGSTGANPATLRAVYINESLTICTLSFASAPGATTSKQVDGSTGTVIPYRTVFIVSCTLPGASNMAVVKLVFDEGEVYAKAGRLV